MSPSIRKTHWTAQGQNNRSAAAMRHRGGGLRQMPDLLNHVLDPAARRRGLAEAKLLTDWANVIGADLAGRCHPIRLASGGMLHLHVTGVVALEIQHTELQLIERINVYFGYAAVSRLRLIQAPRGQLKPSKPAPPPLPDLAPDEERMIESMTAPIDDPGLRAALSSLGGTLKQRVKLRR